MTYFICVRVLLCVSSVPASCVHIWFVSCPRQMWLLVNSCPAVFVSLSIINLCIYSPVCSLWFCLVYSLFSVFPVCKPCLVLPCLALMSLLNNIIWVYVLVCVFLYPPCCVHRDRRPDLTVSGAPSPRFVLFVFSCFYLFQCFVSRSKRVRRLRALMPADRGRSPPPAVAIPGPPAGSLVPGLPLPQARHLRVFKPPSAAHRARRSREMTPPSAAHRARRSREMTPPARRWLNARWIAADSSPPAATNPSPVDPVHTSRPGEPCMCLVVPTGTF